MMHMLSPSLRNLTGPHGTREETPAWLPATRPPQQHGSTAPVLTVPRCIASEGYRALAHLPAALTAGGAAATTQSVRPDLPLSFILYPSISPVSAPELAIRRQVGMPLPSHELVTLQKAGMLQQDPEPAMVWFDRGLTPSRLSEGNYTPC